MSVCCVGLRCLLCGGGAGEGGVVPLLDDNDSGGREGYAFIEDGERFLFLCL